MKMHAKIFHFCLAILVSALVSQGLYLPSFRGEDGRFFHFDWIFFLNSLLNNACPYFTFSSTTKLDAQRDIIVRVENLQIQYNYMILT